MENKSFSSNFLFLEKTYLDTNTKGGWGKFSLNNDLLWYAVLFKKYELWHGYISKNKIGCIFFCPTGQR